MTRNASIKRLAALAGVSSPAISLASSTGSGRPGLGPPARRHEDVDHLGDRSRGLADADGLDDHLTARQLNRMFHAAKTAAEIDKPTRLHTLRHCFAPQLLEQKVDIRVIQVLLGHAKLNTTAHYSRVDSSTLKAVKSPPELLDESKKAKAS